MSARWWAEVGVARWRESQAASELVGLTMYVCDYAAAYRSRRLGSHRSSGVKRAKHPEAAHVAAATGKESSCQLLEDPSARAGKCAS